MLLKQPSIVKQKTKTYRLKNLHFSFQTKHKRNSVIRLKKP